MVKRAIKLSSQRSMETMFRMNPSKESVWCIKELKKIYRVHGLEVVHRSDYSLKQSSGSIKYIPPDIHKSGICSIQCRSYWTIYYGMSVMKLYERYYERESSANWKTKTAVGAHISDNHKVHISGLKLVQSVGTDWNTEYYGTIQIHKIKHREQQISIVCVI